MKSSLVQILLCLLFSLFLLSGIARGDSWIKPSPDCQRSDFDESAMVVAIEEAKKNLDAPFGASLFNCSDGTILARGHNDCISYITHGEMQTISSWTKQCQWQEGKPCTKSYYHALSAEIGLASTGAPCMCATAIAWMGFGRVVYASNYSMLAKYNWQPAQPTQQQILDGFVTNPYSKDVAVRSNVLNNLTDPLFVNHK
mmetsp:Transcript_14070/g.21178  ORF Transcript_14070/g.21178 Transcript_14070/m.21178 type:complete len:199 (+) Transcript_14070:159-755(+)